MEKWRSTLGRIVLWGMLCLAGPSWGQANNAQFVSQSLPTQLTVNQTANVSVVFKNTGTTSWTATAGDKLGSQNPQDNTTWGASRVPLNSGETIAPGQQKSFQFTIKAPATAGVYNFQTKMVREGVAWYGSASPNLTITVSAPKVYYMHVDHLNTPRLVTDEQKVVVWRNTPVGEPFGQSAAEEDPDGNGQKFVMNLRFPGQYFDKETSLHYNYYRDYNPQTGRYIQSDPIGLRGGINTYGYVGGNPLSYMDPRGEHAATVAVVGIVAIVGGTMMSALPKPKPKASDSAFPEAANDSKFGGGTCPPDCAEQKALLDQAYIALMQLEKTGSILGKAVNPLQWTFFWGKVKIYELQCGSYTPPFSDDMSKIQDFYGK